MSLISIAAIWLAVMALPGKTPPTLDFTMPDIDGKSVKLSKFKGDVVLVVNVASY